MEIIHRELSLRLDVDLAEGARECFGGVGWIGRDDNSRFGNVAANVARSGGGK